MVKRKGLIGFLNKHNIFLCLMLLVILSSIGCAVEQHKAGSEKLRFNALIFDNHSGMMLENVSVSVQNSRAHMSCSVLLIGRSCSTTFQERNYKGNAVHITWEVNGVAYKTGPFYVTLPKMINSEKVASVAIRFSSEKNVLAEFRY